MKKIFSLSLLLFITMANCSTKSSTGSTTTAALALALSGGSSNNYSVEKFYAENRTKVDDVLKRYADISHHNYTVTISQQYLGNLTNSIATFVKMPVVLY